MPGSFAIFFFFTPSRDGQLGNSRRDKFQAERSPRKRKKAGVKKKKNKKQSLFPNNPAQGRTASGQFRLKLIAPSHQPAVDSPHAFSCRIEKAFDLIGSFVLKWTRSLSAARFDSERASEAFSCWQAAPSDDDKSRTWLDQLIYSQIMSRYSHRQESHLLSLRFQSTDLTTRCHGQIDGCPGAPATYFSAKLERIAIANHSE